MTKEIDQSWTDFLDNLSPELSEAEETSILKQIKDICPLPELFDRQAHVDRARKALFKKEIGKLARLYLSRIALSEVSDKLKSYPDNFKRIFTDGRLPHLTLLVRLKMILEEKKPKKGLLAG